MCDPLSLTHTHKPWLRRFLTGCTLRCEVTLSLLHTHTHKPRFKTISDGMYTPLWCDPLSLTHTHKPRLRRFLTGCTLRCDVTLSLSHTHKPRFKTISDGMYTPLWCDPLSLTHTQAAIKTISDGMYTPLWCDPLSLTHTHKPRLRRFLTGCTLRCDVTLSLSLSHTHTHTHTHTHLN